MRQLLILLFILYSSTGYGQAIYRYGENVRVRLNDTLFSHFHMGDSVKFFFAFTHEHIRGEHYNQRDKTYDTYSHNLFVDKELGQGSVYDTLLDFARRNAIEVCDVNDTSLFLLVPFQSSKKIEGLDLMIDSDSVMAKNFNKKGHYPVPVVNGIYPFWDVSYTGWDKGIKLYVLAAQAGKYADDMYLHDKEGALPPEWEHGYSRGMAINEQKREIYYWLVVW